MAANASGSLVIDRLWMGESGAAPWMRRQGQVSRARNIRHDITVGGAVKRNATELIGDLDSDSASAAFDASETFLWTSIRNVIIAIGDQAIHGWDEDGNPLQVDDQSGGSFMDYINLPSSADPNDLLDVAVDENTIIVLNRSRATETDDAWTYQQALNFLIHGNILTTTTVANDQTSASVDTFDDLPASPSNGAVHRTVADYLFEPAGIYVFYSGAVHANANGYFPESNNWHRIPKSEQAKARYDATKMPHRIVYDEDAGSLTLLTCPWRQRISGTAASNRRMPWTQGELGVTGKLAAVEFQHGRLFLIGDRHVTASRKDDFFNLFVDNVNAVNDSDRIASNITQSGVGKVLHSAVCGESLLIVAENAQLEYGSGDQPLTNSNGRTHLITDFQARDIQPATGPGVVVIVDEFGDVHQYAHLGADAGIVYQALLTAQKPRLLDNKTVKRLYRLGNTTIITIDEDDALINDSFTVQGEIVQSAWGEFGTWEPPVFFDSWAGEMRIITRRADSTNGYSMLSYVHRQIPPPEDMTYQPRLDRLELVQATAMTYDEGSNRTTIPHTGRDGDADRTRMVVRSDGKIHAFVKPIAIDDDGNPQFKGDWTDSDQYIGFTFSASITLSKLYPRLTSQAFSTQDITVFHFESSDYVFTYVSAHGETSTQPWQAARVDIIEIGEPMLETGHKLFGISGDPSKLEITLSSDSPGQCAWLAVEYVLLKTSGRSNN